MADTGTATALRTEDFKDVQLVSVGDHPASRGDGRVTSQDLDNAVSQFKELAALGLKIPIKLGHSFQAILRRSGYPSAGWVTGVRREGDKLVGDLTGVWPKVATMFKAGAYRTRSIELGTLMLKGRIFRRAVVGLAMLGEDIPADPSLDDFVDLLGLGEVSDLQLIQLPDGVELVHVTHFAAGDGPPADTPTVEDEALRNALMELFGLGKDATDEDIVAAVRELKDKVTAANSGGDEDKEKDKDTSELSAKVTTLEATLKASTGTITKLQKRIDDQAAEDFADKWSRKRKVTKDTREQAISYFTAVGREKADAFYDSLPDLFSEDEAGSSEDVDEAVATGCEPSDFEIEVALSNGLGDTEDECREILRETIAEEKGIKLPKKAKPAAKGGEKGGDA